MRVVQARSDKDQFKLTMKYYCNCPRRIFTGKLQSLKSYVFNLEKNTIFPVAQSNESNRTFWGVKKVRFHALQISIAVGFKKKCKRGSLAGSRAYEKQKTFKTNLNVEGSYSSSLVSIIFDFIKFQWCQIALIFWVNFGRKYTKSTIRFSKHFRPKQPANMRKISLGASCSLP